MGDLITPAVSDRICQHMNDDHADAVALYAKVFGQLADTIQAEMRSIDNDGMTLQVQRPSETVDIRIQFDHSLQDSEDAHHTLIAMVKQARTQTESGAG